MTGIAADAVQQTMIVRVEEVTRTYGSGATEVHALRGVSFTVTRGELVALRGRSGSGKTTLLSIVGGLERPTSGRVEVDGEEVTALSPDGLARMLRERVAFIFQSFGLLPVLSAAENVGLPMRLARLDPAERERRARALLDLVGLGGHAGQRPMSCPAASSSGWRSRVPWPTTPSCCSPTSPPASWTWRPPVRSCGCFAASPTTRASPRSWPPTTRPSSNWPTASWN